MAALLEMNCNVQALTCTLANASAFRPLGLEHLGQGRHIHARGMRRWNLGSTFPPPPGRGGEKMRFQKTRNTPEALVRWSRSLGLTCGGFRPLPIFFLAPLGGCSLGQRERVGHAGAFRAEMGAEPARKEPDVCHGSTRGGRKWAQSAHTRKTGREVGNPVFAPTAPTAPTMSA